MKRVLEDDGNWDYQTRAFRDGTETGFRYFYDALAPLLLYFAKRLINDKQFAEDIVSESFIRVWEKREMFSNPRVIKSYLYSTVRNSCINHLKKNQTQHVGEENLFEYLAGKHENWVLNEIIRAEVLREINLAIKTLPPGCEQIFRMIYFEGKKVTEIADELNLSVFTVKNQKAKGVRLIKEKMIDFGLGVAIEVFLLSIENSHLN